MAFASVSEWDVDAADNTEIDGISLAENVMRPPAVNNAFREMMSQIASYTRHGSDLSNSTGTLNLDSIDAMFLNITGTTTVTAATLTEGHSRRARAESAFQLTASASLVVNGSTSSNYTTSAGDLLFFEGYGSSVVRVWSAGATSAATTSAAGIVEQQFNALYNIGFTASVGSSALTVALKDAEGNDPSSSSPVIIPFRNVTAGTGTPSYITVTAATSVVISSGSTMGFASGVAGRLWIVGFNDGGTFRLGLVNARSGTSIMHLRDGIYSSTAEGGSGGADSAQVIYTGTAVTSKAMVILGYLEATEATAGTWATAPSLVKVLALGDALPGDLVQTVRTDTGAVATGTTQLPGDDSIPQSGEGDEYMTQAITPKSAVNLLSIQSSGVYASSIVGASFMTAALFQDATAGALAASTGTVAQANVIISVPLSYRMLAATTSATTFKVRAGGNAAGTTTFNGRSAGRFMGGVMNSFLQVDELMA